MILRILILVLTFAMPLSAIQDNQIAPWGAERMADKNGCTGCNGCRTKPSAAELLQQVQAVLNSGILLTPAVRAELLSQLIQILSTSASAGITIPAAALDFADFFALMPGDNSATVAPGTPVSFPQNGPTNGTGLIARLNANHFNLAAIGVYQVLFQVSVSEAGQLVLTLNGAELPYTVVGRATGTSQIVGMALVQTSVINSILTVNNPTGESTALTITPLAGGTDPVSAHLVITRLK